MTTTDALTCLTCGHDKEHHVGQQGAAPPACAMCEYEERPQTECDHLFEPSVVKEDEK